MIKQNKIKGYLHYNKSELIDVLVKRGLLPETIKIKTITSLPERENTKKEINPKYNFLKTYAIIQRRLRSKIWKLVKLLYILPCIRLLFNQQSRLISAYDGKVWRNRYDINVLTEYD